MRDYSDAPAWATEAFMFKSADSEFWYYGNPTQFIHRSHLAKGCKPAPHTEDTLRTISGNNWWREPINCIVENE